MPRAAHPKTRISTKVRAFLHEHIMRGRTVGQAAETQGWTEDWGYRLLKRPDILTLRSEMLDLLRSSAASRSIARVDILADTAVSEHVKLGANELLMGIEGISKVTKTENMHVHQHLIPGLTIVRGGWQPHGDDALLIGDQRAQPRIAHEIKRIGTPVPHPEDRNVVIEPSSVSDSRGAKRASRGVK